MTGELLPTTDIERAFYGYDRISPANIVLAARLEGTVDGHLWEEVLNHLGSSHPYLTYGVTPDGRHLIPGRGRIVLAEEPGVDGTWVQACEAEMGHRFDYSSPPLVRARLIRLSPGLADLILTVNHTIADGMGAIQFLKEALEVYQAAVTGERFPDLPARGFHRPATALYPAPVPGKPGQGPCPGFTLAGEVPREYPGLQDLPGTPEGKSRVILRVLEPETFRQVRAFCQANQVTLNAHLSSALLFSLERHLRNTGTPADWIQISCSLDLKRRLAQPRPAPSDLGMWAGRYVVFTSLGAGCRYRPFVQAFGARMGAYLKTNSFDSSFGFVGKTPILRRRFPHAKVTNMGNMDDHGLKQDYGSFRLGRPLCLTPLHRGWSGDRDAGLIPTVFGESLFLSFFLLKGAWSDPSEQDFMDGFVSFLLQPQDKSIKFLSGGRCG